MQKYYLFTISSIIFLLMISLAIWMTFPNHEERSTHQATLCNVIIQNPDLKKPKALFEILKFKYQNRTPSYALHKPKFFKLYSKRLIHQYLNLDDEKKALMNKSYPSCFELLSKV